MKSQKRRGPLPTGKGEPVLVRLQPAQISALDAWIADQDDGPSRPEAIRRLVAKALQGRRSDWKEDYGRLRASKVLKAASNASKMAGRQIDKLGDASATDEERQARKRRLLKGPKEFRDVRGNPKPKG